MMARSLPRRIKGIFVLHTRFLKFRRRAPKVRNLLMQVLALLGENLTSEVLLTDLNQPVRAGKNRIGQKNHSSSWGRQLDFHRSNGNPRPLDQFRKMFVTMGYRFHRGCKGLANDQPVLNGILCLDNVPIQEQQVKLDLRCNCEQLIYLAPHDILSSFIDGSRLDIFGSSHLNLGRYKGEYSRGQCSGSCPEILVVVKPSTESTTGYRPAPVLKHCRPQRYDGRYDGRNGPRCAIAFGSAA